MKSLDIVREMANALSNKAEAKELSINAYIGDENIDIGFRRLKNIDDATKVLGVFVVTAGRDAYDDSIIHCYASDSLRRVYVASTPEYSRYEDPCDGELEFHCDFEGYGIEFER